MQVEFAPQVGLGTISPLLHLKYSRHLQTAVFSLVIGYGDSLIEGLFRHKNAKRIHVYRPNTTSYHDGPDLELNNKTVDHLMDKFRGWHGHQLNQTNAALVIGSAVWDLLSKDTVDPDYASHLEGVLQYVKQLQQD